MLVGDQDNRMVGSTMVVVDQDNRLGLPAVHGATQSDAPVPHGATTQPAVW